MVENRPSPEASKDVAPPIERVSHHMPSCRSLCVVAEFCLRLPSNSSIRRRSTSCRNSINPSSNMWSLPRVQEHRCSSEWTRVMAGLRSRRDTRI